MTPQRTTRPAGRGLRAALAVGVLLLFLAACGRGLPQNTFEPAGSRAERALELYWLVFWIAVGVFVVVEGLLVYTLIRFRRKPGRETPVQIHGNTRAEIIWTIIPAVILAGIAVPTIGTIFDFARDPEGDPMSIVVTGHQWWWEIEYPDLGIVTANELHMPVRQPVLLHLTSDELPNEVEGVSPVPVIHSFWVPRLSGKQDLVPGRTHLLPLDAQEPGVYEGQCAEFCGISHAMMRFQVVAEPREEFDAWVEAQRAGATAPAAGTLAAEGAELFQSFSTPAGGGSCMACHGLRGVEGAEARVAPDLTMFGARRRLGSGVFQNTEENLRQWLRDPRAMKPGAFMPDYGLSRDQVEALAAYLRSLDGGAPVP
ncbi:MAG: cytochrome c oxidase subunit II [Actinomycetota bacterium]|nr:cytochrome c oxidase subunit II [Actinomycetota bacterium]